MLPEKHIESLKDIESGYWWFAGRARWVTQYAQQWLRENNVLPSEVTYLDIGCGTGGLAHRVKTLLGFRKLILSDPDPHVGVLASDPSVTVLKANAGEIDAKKYQAHLISCCDVIEHIENPVPFLQDVAKLLHPNGALILTAPAFPSLYSEWDRKLGHYRRYRMKTLVEQVQEAGFSVRASTYFWAPLFPVGFVRRFQTGQSMEFPETAPWLNQMLLQWAEMEMQLSRWVKLPFGTSIILRAATRQFQA